MIAVVPALIIAPVFIFGLKNGQNAPNLLIYRQLQKFLTAPRSIRRLPGIFRRRPGTIRGRPRVIRCRPKFIFGPPQDYAGRLAHLAGPPELTGGPPKFIPRRPKLTRGLRDQPAAVQKPSPALRDTSPDFWNSLLDLRNCPAASGKSFSTLQNSSAAFVTLSIKFLISLPHH